MHVSDSRIILPQIHQKYTENCTEKPIKKLRPESERVCDLLFTPKLTYIVSYRSLQELLNNKNEYSISQLERSKNYPSAMTRTTVSQTALKCYQNS